MQCVSLWSLALLVFVWFMAYCTAIVVSMARTILRDVICSLKNEQRCKEWVRVHVVVFSRFYGIRYSNFLVRGFGTRHKESYNKYYTTYSCTVLLVADSIILNTLDRQYSLCSK